MKVIIKNNEACKNAIISIGQELIKRAEDISNDLERVISITINANLNPTEVVNFNVNKNYISEFDEEAKNE